MKKFIIAGIIYILTLAACFSTWQGGDEGSFTIIIGSPDNNRMVLPWDKSVNIEDLTHTIEVSDGPGNEQSITVTGSQYVHFTVEPGPWKIFIQAYIMDGEEKIVKAEGSENVTIKPGRNGAISITMREPSGNVQVTGVMLDCEEGITLRVGNQGILIATVEPDNATNKEVTWNSSNTTVATVSNGTVTAVSVGTATITVTTRDGGKTASCPVEVVPANSDKLTGTVTITGTTEIGQTLRVDTSKLDKGTYTYQWKRGDEDEATEVIGTSSTYITTSEDVGKYIWIFVTCAGFTGEASAKVGPVVIPVTLTGVTADGSVEKTTTALTFTFDKAIIGLSADDITLEGVDHISKGTLSGNGPSYTLPISGFKSSGTLNVSVWKTGYNISGLPKTVSIHYITYTVTFNTGVGGSTVSTQTIPQNGKAIRPDNPTLSGYGFVRWCSDEGFETEYDFSNAVTRNITLYAQWSATTYAITFNANGGTPSTVATVGEGGTATPPDPTPTLAGYALEGWYTSEELTTKYNFPLW